MTNEEKQLLVQFTKTRKKINSGEVKFDKSFSRLVIELNSKSDIVHKPLPVITFKRF